MITMVDKNLILIMYYPDGKLKEKICKGKGPNECIYHDFDNKDK
jgi:hypothetical protein